MTPCQRDDWKPMNRREDTYSRLITRASWIIGIMAALCALAIVVHAL